MRQLRVALIGVNAPGYRSLALDYLEASVRADRRLGDIVVARKDSPVTTDAWWIAYDVLRMAPAPDVLALPVMCWTARVVYDVARVVRASLPGIRIVVGGPEVGANAAEVLAEHPELDAVVRGEGEFTFPELLFAYARGGDPCAVPGVTARDGAAVVEGPDRPAIEDMDSIPSPFQAREHATDGSAFVETYRGCPHRCAYCFEGKGSTLIRSYSWERIAADIDAVASTPGMRAFSFIDPVFNLTPSRLERLAQVMEPHVARGVRLHTIEVDIERVDADAARLLRAAGVVSVETGPQSVGGIALDTCHRAFDEGRFRAGVEACRSAGISVECDLIVGLPGDTVDDVMRGLDLALGIDPGKVQLSTLHVLPGTELWARAEELGLVFDHEPPHELIATRDISFTELRRLEEFGNAACAVYRARLVPREA